MKLSHTEEFFFCESTFAEKDIPKNAGFRWDPARRRWWTENSAKAEKLRQYADESALAALTQIEEKIVASTATTTTFDPPCPEGQSFLPYQKAGIEYALARPNVLYADEMGLGKTIQAIGIINADLAIKKILIVCPASLKLNWRNELQRWLTKPMTISIINDKESCLTADIVIMNYDIIEKHLPELLQMSFDLLVCDEAHYLKNNENRKMKLSETGKWVRAGRSEDGEYRYVTRRVQGIFEIAKICTRRILLTGTAIVNRPKEIFTLTRLLEVKSTPSNFFAFAKKYCGAYQKCVRQRGGGKILVWNFDGASNLGELQNNLRAEVMIRRLKKDVLTELPPKRRQIFELPCNGNVQAVLAENEAWKKFQEQRLHLKKQIQVAKKEEDKQSYEAAVRQLQELTGLFFSQISKLRHDTAVVKLPQIIDHIKDVIENEDKLVVFAHHHDVIDGLMASLNAESQIAVKLDGRMSIEQKQAAVEAFQTNPAVKVFVGSIQAAGVGITLTAASTAVFAELDWTPGNITQAEDRLHRIGQQDSVNIIHLVLGDSLDANMAKLLVRKQAVIDEALNNPQKGGEEISDLMRESIFD